VTPIWKFIIVILVVGSTAGCSGGHSLPPVLTQGEFRLPVNGGSIWYRVSGQPGGAPVVLLHGGPGFSSYYIEEYDALGSGRQVIRYDQLGGGKSDRITDTSLFTIDRFVTELDSLRRHLGVERWHIVGHSWGTILAVEYYRKYPTHVISMVLGGAALDIGAWQNHARELLTTLTDASQRAIRRAEETKKYDDSSYQNAIAEFYGKYVWRNPVQSELDSTMATFNEVMYNYMQGPSEFTITGTLRDYTAMPFLRDIRVPVLYTVGEYDEAGPDNVRRYADATPGSMYVVLKGAAHMAHWDAREETLSAMRAFLAAVDSVNLR
jgi:proline iminopeptidase